MTAATDLRRGDAFDNFGQVWTIAKVHRDRRTVTITRRERVDLWGREATITQIVHASWLASLRRIDPPPPVAR